MLRMFPQAPGAEASAIWLDLLAPTAGERASAEALVGSDLPTREALSEIETSSRILNFAKARLACS